MNVAKTSPVDASHVPLEQLAGNTSVSDSQKVAEVARQFEAVLLRQILSEAHVSEASHDAASAGIYSDMMNNQLADTISRSGNLGFAKSLEHQLTQQVLPRADASAKAFTKLSPSSTNPH